MSEDKKNPAVKEKGMDKSSCDSKQPQSCNKEDENKNAPKADFQQDTKKKTIQHNTEHKHGSCSH